MSNIMALLEYLDDELNRSSSVPLTGKKLVDVEKCLDIVSELRVSLPDGVAEADRIVRERDAIFTDAEQKAQGIIADSEQRADDIIAQAETQFERMVAESEVMMEAQRRADALVTEARREGRDIRSSAMQYADELLEAMEKHTQGLVADIRKNRKDLNGQQ